MFAIQIGKKLCGNHVYGFSASVWDFVCLCCCGCDSRSCDTVNRDLKLVVLVGIVFRDSEVYGSGA